jgi:WD40 repeat protein
MDAKRLENFRRRLHQSRPLIGAWLRRKAVGELARDGSSESIVMLAEAAERPADERFRQSLTEAVERLKAHQRALFYFLTGQWEQYESLDFDHTLLRMVYEAGHEDLRKRIAEQARRAGRVDWVEVVTGGRRKRRMGEMTDDEWNATLAVLFDSRRWEELWRLAREAPPRLSAQILQRMNSSSWKLSNEEERVECAQLMELAMKWNEQDLSSLIYCRATLEKQANSIAYLSISPDGRLLVSGNGNGEIHFWSLPDGALIKTSEEHAYCIFPHIGASRDGRVEAYLDNDGTIHLWSLPDDARIKPWEGQDLAGWLAISPGWGRWVESDAYIWHKSSPDWGMVMERSGEKSRRWGKPNAAVIRKTLKGRRGPMRCFSISPDGRLLASADREDDECWAVRLWSLPDCTLIRTLGEHRRPEGNLNFIWCLSISQDGRLLAAGGNMGIWLWSLPDGIFIKAMEHHITIDSLAISSDKRLLAGGDKRNSILLWSLPDGALIKTLDQSKVKSLAFSPDGRLLASGDWGGAIRIWALNPIRLCHLPIAMASQDDFEWVQETLREGKIAESAQQGLEFIAALMRRQRRYDILVEETPRRIEVGAFDIEI